MLCLHIGCQTKLEEKKLQGTRIYVTFGVILENELLSYCEFPTPKYLSSVCLVKVPQTFN